MRARAWIWSAVVVSTAGVGIPMAWQNAQRRAPPEPIDRPAEGSLEEELVFADSFEGAAPAEAAEPAAAAGALDDAPHLAASGAAQVDESSLDASLARLERLLPRPRQRELDRLARGESPAPDAEAAAVDAPAAAVLKAFLEENPLCGVLSAPEGATALFGLRALRVGDALLAGRARVHAVGARSVTLEIDGTLAQVDLPPLAPSGPAQGHGAAHGTSEVQP